MLPEEENEALSQVRKLLHVPLIEGVYSSEVLLAVKSIGVVDNTLFKRILPIHSRHTIRHLALPKITQFCQTAQES